MNLHGPNIVGVRLPLLDLLGSGVVEDSELHVVRCAHEPTLANDKFRAAYGKLGDLKRLRESLGFIIPQKDLARGGVRWGGVGLAV